MQHVIIKIVFLLIIKADKKRMDAFCWLYFSNREFLRMLAFEVLEIEFYVFHFFVYISCRHKTLCALDQLSLVVDTEEEHGDLRLEGDIIESVLPVGVERACAFGVMQSLNAFLCSAS